MSRETSNESWKAKPVAEGGPKDVKVYRRRQTRSPLLRPETRTLSTKAVARMTDKQVLTFWCKARWPETQGKPVCPDKDCRHPRCYTMNAAPTGPKTKRRRVLFKCAACRRIFSPTSGTIYKHRKLPLRDLVLLISRFSKPAKGVSGIDLSLDLDHDHRTAFVWQHKIRDVMAEQLPTEPFTGRVELDGAGYGGTVKQANKFEERVDRRKTHPNRKTIVALRQRGGEMRAFVYRHESHIAQRLPKLLDPSATLFTDGAPSWNEVGADNEHKFVIHGELFSYPDPEDEFNRDANIHINGAESYFSRVDRSEMGVYHRIAGPYLLAYASEMAWRENKRKVDTMQKLTSLIFTGCQMTKSSWANYWQRCKEGTAASMPTFSAR